MPAGRTFSFYERVGKPIARAVKLGTLKRKRAASNRSSQIHTANRYTDSSRSSSFGKAHSPFRTGDLIPAKLRAKLPRRIDAAGHEGHSGRKSRRSLRMLILATQAVSVVTEAERRRRARRRMIVGFRYRIVRWFRRQIRLSGEMMRRAVTFRTARD